LIHIYSAILRYFANIFKPAFSNLIVCRAVEPQRYYRCLGNFKLTVIMENSLNLDSFFEKNPVSFFLRKMLMLN